MIRRAFLPTLLLLFACTALHADVTVRMEWNMVFQPVLGILGAAPEVPLVQVTIRVKGDRGYASLGPMVTLTDLSRRLVTIVDPRVRRYATVTMADYVARLADANAHRRARPLPGWVTGELDVRETGRSDTVLGIQVHERKVTAFYQLVIDAVGQPLGITLECWKPGPEELERVPALRELAMYYGRNQGLDNPATTIRQILAVVPGVGMNASKAAEEIVKGGNILLRMRLEVLDQRLLQSLITQLTTADGHEVQVHHADTEEPNYHVMVLDLKELSSGAVPEEVFAIPTGYKQAPVEDLMRGLLAALDVGIQTATLGKQ